MLEAPDSTLEFDPAGHIEVELASGRTIRIQEVEELLLLRLAEFVATGNADVFQQCLWLLGVSGLDRERLRARAAERVARSCARCPRSNRSDARPGCDEAGDLGDHRSRTVVARDPRGAITDEGYDLPGDDTRSHLRAMASRPARECRMDRDRRSRAARVRATPTSGCRGGRAVTPAWHARAAHRSDSSGLTDRRRNPPRRCRCPPPPIAASLCRSDCAASVDAPGQKRRRLPRRPRVGGSSTRGQKGTWPLVRLAGGEEEAHAREDRLVVADRRLRTSEFRAEYECVTPRFSTARGRDRGADRESRPPPRPAHLRDASEYSACRGGSDATSRLTA